MRSFIICTLYYEDDKIKNDDMGRDMQHAWERLKMDTKFSEGKRQLGRIRHRWEDSIKMNLREIWWESVDQINLYHI
jgi:hypothetical protein